MTRRNIMEEFRMDEISAVDRPAQVGAKAVIMKRAAPMNKLKPRDGETKAEFVARFMSDDRMQKEYPDAKQRVAVANSMFKRLAMTTMSAGHAHLIVGAVAGTESLAELRAGKTSFADGHVHDWMMDDAGNIVIGDADGHTHGNIVIGDADGHTHGIAAIVMKSNEVELPEGGLPADSPTQGDQPAGSNDTAAAASGEEADMTKQNEDQAAKTQAAELEKLTKRAERAEKLAELSDAQKVLLKGLAAEDQDKFLALDGKGRDAQIEKARAQNEVVFTDEDGVEYRKNDDPRLIALAKRSFEDRKKAKEAERKAKEAEVEKLAAELSTLPGEGADRKALIKIVLDLPEAQRESALKSLRTQNRAMAKAFETIGSRSAPTDGSPEAELEALAEQVRKGNPKMTKAQAMVAAMDSPEGLKIYAKHLEAARS